MYTISQNGLYKYRWQLLRCLTLKTLHYISCMAFLRYLRINATMQPMFNYAAYTRTLCTHTHTHVLQIACCRLCTTDVHTHKHGIFRYLFILAGTHTHIHTYKYRVRAAKWLFLTYLQTMKSFNYLCRNQKQSSNKVKKKLKKCNKWHTNEAKKNSNKAIVPAHSTQL